MIRWYGTTFKNAWKQLTLALISASGFTFFYHNISSCVVNNAHASEPFLLETGVQQGYPLSGMLFVIATEVLSQKIRRSKMINGIEIEYSGSQEITLSQYADGTTAFLSDSESVMQLFELLGLFERCSGLKKKRIKIGTVMAWFMAP